MSFTISCYTLFDITQTGTVNRNRPSLDEDENVWLHKRNTQCNFDTVLQAVSLRSQPEILNYPTQKKIKFDEFDNFGFLFEQQDDEEYSCCGETSQQVLLFVTYCLQIVSENQLGVLYDTRKF